LKDLIDKLLQVNPQDRLGAEMEEGKNTLEDLKAHKFFQGIIFKDIHKRSPPLPENVRLTMELNTKASKVPMKLDDVDSDEDDSAKEAHTKTQSVADGYSKTVTRNTIAETIKYAEKRTDVDNKKLDTKNKYNNGAGSKNPEDTIKEAIVEKRNKWYFYQDRTLKLTKDLRLMYFTKGDYRGDITLSKKVSVRKDKIHHFDVITPNKIFHFRCKEGDSASEWVKLIRSAIKTKVEREKQAHK